MFPFQNIDAYQEALTAGKVQCRDAVNFYLQRIREHEHLNAVVHTYAEESLQRAEALDRKKVADRGKLFGVIVTIKDVISYENHPLRAASKMLLDFDSGYNSTAVQRLLDEDAIIIGACNCDEFAMGSTNEYSVYGRVKNALDETKVAGGSSGGSAVSVQADLCMLSLGSDTGGSVRQPADFCGVVGYKPTYGTISRHGLIAYASSFDQIGIFAKSVEDVAKVIAVIGGEDEMDSTMRQGKLLEQADTALGEKVSRPEEKYKIAVWQNALQYEGLDNEIKDQLSGYLEPLKAKGHTVTSVKFPLLPYIVPTYYILTTAEASSNLGRYDGVRYGFRKEGVIDDPDEFYKANRSEGFGREVKRRIMLGTFVLSEGYFDAYFTKAQKVRKKLLDETLGIFNNFDFLLMPTVPETAFEAGAMLKDPLRLYLADIFTVFANLTGVPAISLPLFQHSNGMPFGLQLHAAPGNDLNLLACSAQLLRGQKN